MPPLNADCALIERFSRSTAMHPAGHIRVLCINASVSQNASFISDMFLFLVLTSRNLAGLYGSRVDAVDEESAKSSDSVDGLTRTGTR